MSRYEDAKLLYADLIPADKLARMRVMGIIPPIAYSPMLPRVLLEDYSLDWIRRYLPFLCTPGVYVLYNNRQLRYYTGQSVEVIRRLLQHALKPKSRHFHKWEYFTFFQIVDDEQRTQIEAILIALGGSTSENRARPKIKKLKLSDEACRELLAIRKGKSTSPPGAKHKMSISTLCCSN